MMLLRSFQNGLLHLFVSLFLLTPGIAQVTPIELASPNEEISGQFGYSVSGVPDVNGDGRGDVVVGALLEDPGTDFQEAGRSYIYDGQTGALLQTLLSPNPQGTSGEERGEFGKSVSGMADVSGDGRGEVVIGAPGESPGSSTHKAGRAYIFNGATGALLHTLASPNEDYRGAFGYFVSGVRDTNGDGRDDVIVGAPGENPGISPPDSGRAYIFDGATGSLLHTLISPNEEPSGNFGGSVAGVPDVNGDNRGDVLVGAPSEDPGASPPSAGRAYLFDGATGALLQTLVSPNEEVAGSFGLSVSGVPDVNGDSRGDVVIGAYQEDPGASPTDAGRAYIFNGADGALLHTLVSPTDAMDGEFGGSVSGVSDIDGDGNGDVVIGIIVATPSDLGPSPFPGNAYTYSGSTGTFLQTLSSPNEETDGHFGGAVSGVPDINGDGRGDIAIGAHYEDPGASPSNAGRAYIFHSPDGPLYVRDWSLY